MFDKLMNRYYYGKSGQGDFTPDDLPHTRWQLFWDTLRVRLMGLVRLNLLYAVCWLPAMVVIARALLVMYSGLGGAADLQAQAASGALTREALSHSMAQYSEALRGLLLQTLLWLAPCLAITGPCTAGLCYVTRNWARDEHAFIWSDFRDAARENWKQALLHSSLSSLMPLIFYVCLLFYGSMAEQNRLFLIPQVVSLGAALLWMGLSLYVYPQMVTYRLRYRDLLRNSLLMFVGRLPASAGLRLLALLPAAVCALVCLLTPYALYALLALGLYYLLIGFALGRFVGASYTNAVFDRYLNVRIEGAQVGRGLHPEEDEDDEDGGK